MRKTKLFFGIMILFFAFLIIFTSFFYDKSSLAKVPMATGYSIFDAVSAKIFPEKTLTYTNYDNSTKNTSDCTFNPPENKTIILRLDDLGAWHYYDTVKTLVGDITKRNMSVSLGVIPYGLERDQPFIDYMNSVKNQENIEITQHGYMHNESEFSNLTYDEAYSSIQAGKNEIVDNLGVVPITFIPPSNDYNSFTIQALKDSGFRIISGRDSEYKTDGVMNYFGSDTGTYDFSKNEFVPVSQVISDCETQLEKKNLCIITLHPQDYSLESNPAALDQKKYAEFLKLLDQLKLEDTEFKTFKDLVSCN